MKKIILTLALIFGLSGISMADETAPVIKFSGVNLSGDTTYLLNNGEFSPAVGYQVATFYNDLLEVRAEYIPLQVVKADEEDKVGIGIGVNIPRLLQKTGGTWKIELNPTLGFLVIADINRISRVQVAPYVNIVNVKF